VGRLLRSSRENFKTDIVAVWDDVLRGVRVAGDVHAIFEDIEPRGDGLPSWRDMDIPDGRFVASTLLLQSRHQGSAVYVATGDINLQTRLSAVGLPFIDAL
jgi:hypothetical protein